MKYLADRDVVDVWEQPPPVAFRDASGQLRHHTFDFKLTLRSGERWLVEVKPWRRAEAMNLRARLRLIASQTSREIADRIVLVTEKVLDRDSVHNAALIHAMARRRDPEADAHVAAWMADRLGTVTIADLVTGTGLGGRGFCACIRLIADGTLVSTRSQRLDYSATVARAGAASGGIAA
ncbi:hypothetical protein [Methylobacterium sp.]|uniref:hypothetical protein n=1 Tax=Methylobacterium sp. TaxID=409 RepID=UPI0015CD5842|nr:hypothetical protein [Methylobacterium sp.]